MWPWDKLVESTRKSIQSVSANIKNEFSKYTINAEYKTTVGIQAGVQLPLGEVKIAPIAVVATKESVTIKDSEVKEYKSTLFNKELDKQTGKVTNRGSVEVESKLGFEAVKSGGEIGQSFRIYNSHLQAEQGSSSSYTQTSLLGYSNKNTYTDDKTENTKSMNFSLGAQFFLGFEISLDIKKVK